MALNRFVLLFSSVFVFTWMTVKVDAPSVHLVRQSGTDQINPIFEQFRRGLKWSHGAYMFMDELAGTPPVFYMLNRDGAWTDTVRFQDPEPTRFAVFNYDRESNGTIVFTGQTEGAPRAVSPFLAWTSADGKLQRRISTDPYFPSQVAVAPDDTIWTLGYEMVNLNSDDPAVNKEANVLRHFDGAGNLMESAFPQSRFNRYQLSTLTHSLLIATRDRVGWYGPYFRAAPTYTEVLLNTMKMKVYPGTLKQARGPGWWRL